MERFTVLAMRVDLLQDRVEALACRQPIDEQMDVLEIDSLASRFGTTADTMRRQITEVLGASVVFKLGKKRVIRKTKFLEFLELKETALPE